MFEKNILPRHRQPESIDGSPQCIDVDICEKFQRESAPSMFPIISAVEHPLPYVDSCDFIVPLKWTVFQLRKVDQTAIVKRDSSTHSMTSHK